MSTATETSGTDLSQFVEMGKVPWEKRAQKVRARFQSVDAPDWRPEFENDLDLFGRVMRDILKLEQAVPGRPGPRPALDVADATRRLRQLFGDDFTIEPFHVALNTLAGGRSIRHLAAGTGLHRDCIHRLRRGTMKPDGYMIRQVAKYFGKHPSYFLEWRQLYIIQAIMARLEWSPDTTIDLFLALDGQRKAVGK